MTGLPLITCPACQTEMGLEALLGTDDARGVVEIMARMPGPPTFRKAVLRYVGLFAPAKQKLRWGRVEHLIEELLVMVESGRIERNGRTWPAPLDYWQAALEAVLSNATLRRPLKSHGYLLEVLVGIADKTEAKSERRAEDQAAGRTPVGSPPPPGEGRGGEGTRPASADVAPSPRPSPTGRGRTAMPQSVKDTLKKLTTANKETPHG